MAKFALFAGPHYSAQVNRGAIQAIVVGLIVVMVGGCTRTKRRVLVPSLPQDSAKAAQTRFLKAHQLFLRDSHESIAEFESIAHEFPFDPIAMHARLYAGIAAVQSRRYEQAAANLQPVVDTPDAPRDLRRRAQLFLGIAWVYTGDHGQALPLLQRSSGAVQSDEERFAWTASMAEALRNHTTPLASTPYYNKWFQLGTPAERIYILSQLEQLFNRRSPEHLRRAYEALPQKNSVVGAILANKLAQISEAKGDYDHAAYLRQETSEAQEKLSSYQTGQAESISTPAAPRLGAILPLQGKAARIGELALRGIALASGSFGELGQELSPLAVSVRGSEHTLQSPTPMLRDLVEQGAIAIVGPTDSRASQAVAHRIKDLSIAQLSLSPRRAKTAPDRAPVFYFVHSAESRSRALARHAFKLGVRDFAILAPHTGYGRAMTRAFRKQVEELGGHIVVSARYEANATAFGDVIRTLRKPWQAIFVPEQARRLELIAPALAAENLISRPYHSGPPPYGRKILLLSTAEFLAPKFIGSTARYAQGAVFAPGFYPDRTDSLIGDFVDRYEHAFGRLPTTLDAYSYDAVASVQTAMKNGATSRAQIIVAMRRLHRQGITGTIAFDQLGQRTDSGRLFTVERTSNGRFLIKTLP